MPTWLKVVLGGLALITIAVLAVAGTGAYFFFSNLEHLPTTEGESVKTFEAVKTRFGSRPSLVEILDLQAVNVRINRPEQPSGTRVETLHIVTWKSEANELMTTDVPLWLMRFSSVNILSQLGVAPEKFRLTVRDIERYGPGVVVEFVQPGDVRLLVWVD